MPRLGNFFEISKAAEFETLHESGEIPVPSSSMQYCFGSDTRIKSEKIESELAKMALMSSLGPKVDSTSRFPDCVLNPAAFDHEMIHNYVFPVPGFDQSNFFSLFHSFKAPSCSGFPYLNAVDSPQSPYASTESKEASIRHDTEVDSNNAPGRERHNTCSFAGDISSANEFMSQGLPVVHSAALLPSSLLQPELVAEGLSPSLHSFSMVQPEVSEVATTLRDSNASPSQHDSPAQNSEDSDTDLRNQPTKRRKAQPKRVVCVPVAGDSKQKGEAPPSDMWAWRKYGQKPIKGSPYPRGYYRCSSSKGCSARKQVERSRSDPSMLIISYTSDHNHEWPGHRNSGSVGAKRLHSRGQHRVQKHDRAGSELLENPFSIINSSTAGADQQLVSSLEPIQVDEHYSLERDVDLCLVRSNTEEDDLFAELGELPELSAIFRKGFLEYKSPDASRSSDIDMHGIFNRPANALLGKWVAS